MNNSKPKEKRSRTKRKTTTSPRKKNKTVKQRKVSTKDKNTIESETGEVFGVSEEGSKQRTFAVRFQEGEDEFVDMEIEDENQFPSEEENEEENSKDDSSEEEGEISFNNNASRVREPELSTERAPKPKLINENENKGQEESNIERENRIIAKTVAKLQEMMAAGGYFRNPLREEVMKEIRKPEKRQNEKGKSTNNDKNNKVPICELTKSVSESTIYQNAVEPAKDVEKIVDVINVKTSNNVAEEHDQVNTEIGVAGQPNMLRVSTSSEEELGDVGEIIYRQNDVGQKITDFLNQLRYGKDEINTRVNIADEGPQPSTSRGIRSAVQIPTGGRQAMDGQQVLEENVTRLIREADTSKARALEPQGKLIARDSNPLDNQNRANLQVFEPNQFMRTAMMDEGLSDCRRTCR